MLSSGRYRTAVSRTLPDELVACTGRKKIKDVYKVLRRAHGGNRGRNGKLPPQHWQAKGRGLVRLYKTTVTTRTTAR